ncbi:MAG: hypothetical protein M5U34_27925 [Chloroflexi bacterium]|nr:hypothetical protein [Chloroflexota bacterium]
MIEIDREWSDELAGAIICAFKNAEKCNGHSGNGDSQPIFKRWFKELDISRVDKLELKNEWIRTWFTLHQEIQYDVPNIEDELRPDTPVSEDEPYPPLAHKCAEDEEQTLYIKNAFWPGNPAYYEFVNHNNRNQIIFGVSGSGLTALAKGIWTNESRWTPYFWCYIPIYPGMEAVLNPVNIALSRQLLKYVLHKPLRLSALEPCQRELLATVLVHAFSANSLCAQIERISAQSSWLTEASENYKEEWRQVGKTQLTLLAGCILKQDEGDPSSPYQWLHALIESYQSLGFKQLRLLFDFAPNTEALAKKMIYMWAEWQSNGVISTFFLPTRVKEKLTLDKNRIHQIELAWNAEQLDELIKHRYYRISRQRPAWRYVGGTLEKYQAFLDQLGKPLTPRLLVEGLHGEEPPKVAEEQMVIPEIPERNRFLDWALTRFNGADLEIICFKLGIKSDHLKRETTPQFLMSIIQDSENKTRVGNLLKIFENERPKDWPDFAPWESG